MKPRPPRFSATRCADVNASWFERPTWKVEKVRRRSSGEPTRAFADTPGAGWADARRAAGAAPSCATGAADEILGLTEEGSGQTAPSAGCSPRTEDRTTTRMRASAPNSAASAAVTWPR